MDLMPLRSLHDIQSSWMLEMSFDPPLARETIWSLVGWIDELQARHW